MFAPPRPTETCGAGAGAAGFATVAPLQKRVMDKAKGAPALASAANIAAFTWLRDVLAVK